jgi:KaiC/GvpD/RAD55 family RecA-like ATPase
MKPKVAGDAQERPAGRDVSCRHRTVLTRGPHRPPVFKWSEVDPQNEPMYEYLVDGLLPSKGTHLLLGRPKQGKSQMAAHIVACVLSRTPVFGHYEVRTQADPVGILWIMTEETRYKPRARVEANLRGFGWDDQQIRDAAREYEDRITISARDSSMRRVAPSRLVFSFEAHEEWLLRAAQSDSIDLVVIDSLRPAHGKEENSSTDMLPITRVMRELSAHTCTLITHHTGHSNAEFERVGGDASRGTTDLDAARDSAIQILRGKFGEPMVLGVYHRDDDNAYISLSTHVDRDSQSANWKYLGDFSSTAKAESTCKQGALLQRIDTAQSPTTLPSKTDAKALIGDGYLKVIQRMEGREIVEVRKVAGPKGRPREVIARPNQFDEGTWRAAEQQAGAES